VEVTGGTAQSAPCGFEASVEGSAAAIMFSSSAAPRAAAVCTRCCVIPPQKGLFMIAVAGGNCKEDFGLNPFFSFFGVSQGKGCWGALCICTRVHVAGAAVGSGVVKGGGGGGIVFPTLH